MEKPAKWTVLIYIAAHNNLSMQGEASLKQWLDAKQDDAVRLAALIDTSDYSHRHIPSLGEAREFTKQEFDSGDPKRLIETAKWAFEACPAEKYGLVLWSHGTGWMPKDVETVAGAQINFSEVEAKLRAGEMASPALFRTTVATMLNKPSFRERAICFDDGSQHALDTLELAHVTSAISEIATQVNQKYGLPEKTKLDLLGLDACLMGSLEVAYELRNSVAYLVASEETVPGTSWPYDVILRQLADDADMGAAELAKLIVKAYLDFYTQNRPCPVCGDVTKLALDLSQIDSVAGALTALSSALLRDMPAQRQALWTAQRKTWIDETVGGRRSPNKFEYHLWDVGSLCAVLAKSSQNAEVQAAAKAVLKTLKTEAGAVLAEAHLGGWFKDVLGLSLYLAPPGMTHITEYYKGMALAKDTKWGEVLEAYHQK